jgi:hypothetical protein
MPYVEKSKKMREKNLEHLKRKPENGSQPSFLSKRVPYWLISGA